MAAEPSNKRKDRLAAALKENLKRRKAQVRAKASRAETARKASLEDRPETALTNVPNRT